MKIGILRAIAHNVADSLGSGIGMLVGVYDIDIFAEAQRSPGGVISIDFLAAKATRGHASPALARAITKYHKALPDPWRPAKFLRPGPLENPPPLN